MMPSKTSNTDQQLADLNQLLTLDDQHLVQSTLQQALQSKNNRIVAKAADICEQKLLYDLEADLQASYQHQLTQKDDNCLAKSALMRALVALDCNDVDFYLAGLCYVQYEPVWGGSVDSAVDVRCSSAMGLISTAYPRAMLELVTLLNDPETNARIGAIRAISQGMAYEAALVLRQKMFTGDPEPEVLGECFIALLAVEPGQSLPLVANYLNSDDDEQYELAAFALGESRLTEALLVLQKAWDATFAIHEDRRRMLLRSIIIHRSQAALDWVLQQLQAAGQNADAGLIEMGIELLAMYKHNRHLKDGLSEIVEQHGNRRHHALFREYWT